MTRAFFELNAWRRWVLKNFPGDRVNNGQNSTQWQSGHFSLLDSCFCASVWQLVTVNYIILRSDTQQHEILLIFFSMRAPANERKLKVSKFLDIKFCLDPLHFLDKLTANESTRHGCGCGFDSILQKTKSRPFADSGELFFFRSQTGTFLKWPKKKFVTSVRMFENLC